MRRLAIVFAAVLLVGCHSRRVPAGVPSPFEDRPCPCEGRQISLPAPSNPYNVLTLPDIDPKFRPENCPDDGIHVVINGVCVDTNGK